MIAEQPRPFHVFMQADHRVGSRTGVSGDGNSSYAGLCLWAMRNVLFFGRIDMAAVGDLYSVFPEKSDTGKQTGNSDP